jgi:putative nucleotidyltransferase with HDIG domain
MPIEGNVAYPETIAHHQRVAYLCSRISDNLSIKGPATLALGLATAVHGFGQSGTRANQPNTSQKPRTRAASLESMLVEMAQEILGPRHGKPPGRRNQNLELSANIFEACNEFDDGVEFAAYNQVSISSAIDDFFNDIGSRFKPGVVDALREISRTGSHPGLSDDLPVLPTAATRLMRCSVETTSAADIEAIVALDPVLTGRLLGTANSALFGARTEIRNLRQAIMRVGIPFARKVLMAACFGRLFGSGALTELWKHSRLVAASAHELAGWCGYDQESAYVAGLLHDIGRLVTQRCPAETRVREAELLQSGFPLVYAETLIYGSDHATLGGDLLKRWSLPSEVVDAVTLHHRPESSSSVLASILSLAEDDVLETSAESENLATGMRRAVAAQLTGIDLASRNQINREAVIFALAG